MTLLSKLRTASRRVSLYIRQDLREIIAPRSMPDPPDMPPLERRTWRGVWQVRTLCLSLVVLGVETILSC